MKRAIWTLLAVLCVLSTARADDARPAYLEVREVRPGLYEVTWKAPMVGGVRLRMAPRFPDGVVRVPESYSSTVLSDALIERWRIEVDGGLAGREIHVDGLASTLRDVIVRVRFTDGRRANALLRGTRPVFVVPMPPEYGLGTLPAKLRDAVVVGLRHGLLDPLHALLAFTVGLAGGWALLGRSLGAFLGANLVGVVLLSLVVAVPQALGEAAVGISAVLAARMAFLGAPHRLTAVAAAAGLVHGAALGSAWTSLSESVAVSLGIDTIHLVFGAAAVALGAAGRSPRIRGFAAYATGVAAVACVFLAASRPAQTEPSPFMASLPTIGADQSTGALAPPPPPLGLTTELAAYLDVEPFETRFEILARLPALDALLGLEVGERGTVEVVEQEPLLEQAGTALAERLQVRIDGTDLGVPRAVLRGFTATDATGVYFRDVPIAEPVNEAIIGFVFALSTPSMPQEVSATWSGLPEGLEEIPAKLTDPENASDAVLSAGSPTLTWRNALRDDPLPPVDAVAVETPVLPLSIPSCLLLIAALVAGVRRRHLHSGSPVARVLLAAACFAAPLGTVPVSAPALRSATPEPREASAIADALLHNIYRAFDYREEQVVYDRLAVSVTSAPLTMIYLEHRQSLEIEKAGGARARVEAVEVTGVSDLQPGAGDGFTAEFTWTVAGSVTHLGHRHVRQNRYRARLAIIPEQGRWKIADLTLLDEERLR